MPKQRTKPGVLWQYQRDSLDGGMKVGKAVYNRLPGSLSHLDMEIKLHPHILWLAQSYWYWSIPELWVDDNPVRI